MGSFLLRRVLWLPVVIWAVASLTFFALRAIPGNPIETIRERITDQTQIARIEAEWGLDKPVYVQYLNFMGSLLRGDLGISMASGAPIRVLMFERIPPTVELTFVAMVISTALGIAAGVISAATRRKSVDAVVRTLSITGMSMPYFWVAILLIIVFSV